MYRSRLQSLSSGLIALVALGAMTVNGAENASWGYEGETGAAHWGELDASYAACRHGSEQSPIDLVDAMPATGGALAVNWRATDAEVVDNGHTIQVNTASGSTMTLEGREFALLQFHFHLPSEHTVEGRSIPMEVHFVHQAAAGDLAVIGVFMEMGGVDAAIDRIWDAIPNAVGEPASIVEFDPSTLLPDSLAHTRYAGSLTTPPCSEIVSWVVLDEMIAVSQAQVDAFASRYPMNARPVQDLHRRFVLSRPE